MGWQKQILRVNLTKGTAEIEPLNMEWANDYLGERGLATKYLYEGMDPKTDPMSPENMLIFATGPLTGTMASTSGRYAVVTKGPLTNVIACSNSGGKFGAELKFAGYDMLILEGKSPKPVYLHIIDEKVEFLPADDIWGTSVWNTEEYIKSKHQNPLLKVASIGEAGEKGVRYACIVNDLHRAAGRSGVGAVMGSKNLKAIAMHGTKGVRVKDPQAFMAAVKETHALLADNTGRKGLTELGTNDMIDAMQEFGGLPTRNFNEVQFEGTSKINPAAMAATGPDGHRNLLTNKACFGCTIACGRIAHIHGEHFSIVNKPEYRHASGGLEYETAYAFGPMLKIDDIDALTYAAFSTNEHGIDPISFGATLAAAMELYEMGVITKDDTDGVELNFGNAEALTIMADKTGKNEGFGQILGLGSKLMCEKYGHPELSMSVKGQEFAGYDSRALQGMGLGFATSNRGACHLKHDVFAEDMEDVSGNGKAKPCKDSQDMVAMIDSTGLCLFTTCAWGAPEFQKQISAACEGDDWSEERLLQIGERVWNLERLYNLEAGITAADDTLPKRLLDIPAPSGTAKGHVSELPKMLPEYYEYRGWTKDGEPTTQTLSRLGLEFEMKHVVLGAGPAGVIAAETLRRADPEGSVMLVCGETESPYSRMALPYLLAGNIGEDGTCLRHGENHYDSLGIELRQGRAASIAPNKGVVALEDGGSIPFDRLLIATGSRPARPPVPGMDLPGVESCWTLDDARRIAAGTKSGSKVVLMGAGFIGCIVLEAMVARGVELTVVEMEDRMLPRMMDDAGAAMIKRWCEAKGITVLTSTAVKSVEAAGKGLKLDIGGETLKADLVVCATGVRPNIEFLEGSGIETDQGILVGDRMQTNMPGIYAAGDVAQGPDFSTGERMVHAIQPTASEHGRIAAMNMAGVDTPYHGSLIMNVLSTLGLITASYGLWQGVKGGERAVAHDENAFKYLRLEFDGEVLVGSLSLGLTQHVGVLRGLIQTKTPLGPWKDHLMRDPHLIMNAYLERAQGQNVRAHPGTPR